MASHQVIVVDIVGEPASGEAVVAGEAVDSFVANIVVDIVGEPAAGEAVDSFATLLVPLC